MAIGQIELLRTVTRQLTNAGVPAAEYAARFLVTEVLECTTAQLLAFPSQPVPDAAAGKIMDAARQCGLRMPVQYAVGHAYFRDLRLRVTPAVMIPRPETEQLVDLTLAQMAILPSASVLDIGTGSGCVALALKKARPDMRVTGCDISQPALDVAAGNAISSGLDVDFLKTDILDPEDAIWMYVGAFDVIISNPPYIPDHERSALSPEVRDHEPAAALFCGGDPLKFYKAILRVARAGMLRPNGLIVVETHADYATQVAGLFAGGGGQSIEIRRDLAGLNRFVLARYG